MDVWKRCVSSRTCSSQTWALRLFFHSGVSRALKRPLLSDDTETQSGRWSRGSSWGVRVTGSEPRLAGSLLLMMRLGQEPEAARETGMRTQLFPREPCVSAGTIRLVLHWLTEVTADTSVLRWCQLIYYPCALNSSLWSSKNRMTFVEEMMNFLRT